MEKMPMGNGQNKFFEKARKLVKNVAVGAVLLHSVEKADAQVGTPVNQPEEDKIENAIDVYKKYSITTNPQEIDSAGRSLGGSSKHTPYEQYIKTLEDKAGESFINPSDYPNKEAFVEAYVKQKRQYYQSEEGKKVNEFKNKYFQGKRDFLYNEIQKYSENPGLFEGGVIGNDGNPGIFYNQKYEKSELLDYLERCHDLIEDIDAGDWTYTLPKYDEDVVREAEEFWQFSNENKLPKNPAQ